MTPSDPSLAAARAALNRGEHWACIQHLRNALRRDLAPPDLQAGVVLGREIGDEWAAVAFGQRLCDATSGAVQSRFLLGEALTDCGRAEEAADIVASVADRLTPDDRFRYSRMLMIGGRIEEAHAAARALLSDYGDSPTLWERLAQTKHFKTSDGDIDAMRRVAERWPSNKAAGRSAICAALAKAMVDLGDDAGAHFWLTEKNLANQARFRFDPAPLEAATCDIEAWCSSGEADPPQADVEGSERPIFILGPNRSGTTLVDQILSRHPAVAAGGERQHFWLVTRPLGDCSASAIRSFSGACSDVRAAWAQIGSRYLALSREIFGAKPRFTDKLLSNIYRVRAITQSLPGAKLIFIRRDPLAVAWSCWRGQFDADSAWSNSPTGVAQYISGYRRAMAAWRARYPSSVCVIDYEELVTRPEAEIPRLLHHCGLDDHPDTRAPHLSKRSASTLSFGQVRQPINTNSVDAVAQFPIATQALRTALEQISERGRLPQADAQS